MRKGDTPVHIPNTMVKTFAADDTMLETAWKSRWLPEQMGLQLSRLERTPDKREVGGSSPLKPIILKVHIRIRPKWGYSSVGRAPALQAGGHEFESRYLHSEVRYLLLNIILRTSGTSSLGHWHTANAFTEINAYSNKFETHFSCKVALNIGTLKITH